MVDRRSLLASLGTVGTVGIAGCSYIDTESTAEDLNSDTNKEGGSLTASSPEEAVKQYTAATNEENVEKMNKLTHPESSTYPIEGSEIDGGTDITLITVEQISFSEMSDIDYISANEENLKNKKEEIKSETGNDEVVLVFVEAEQNDANIKTTYPTVYHDGGWKIYY